MTKLNFKSPIFAFGMIAVVFVGYWLVFGVGNGSDFGSSQPPAANRQEGNLSLDNSPDSLRWVESPEGDKLPSESGPVVPNLTDLISKNIASEFVSKVDFSRASSSPQTLLDQIQSIDLKSGDLSEILGVNPLEFVKGISDSEIKISQDNSSEAIRKYGQEYAIIFSQAGGAIASDPDKFADLLLNPEDSKNSQQLSQISFDLNQGFDKMKSLETPSGVVDFHKRALAFLKNSAIVVEAIKGGEQDPLRAYLAVQEGVPIISSDINYLDEMFKQLSLKYKF